MGEFIDLTGKKYGEWTVIQRIKTEKDKYKSWLCRCKCGTEKILSSIYIRKTWKATDCGCSKTMVGKKYGMLLVVEKLGKKCNTLSNYKCICDCGKEKITRGSYLINAKLKSCGCNQSKKAEEIGPNTVFNHYKQASKKRNLEFNLKKDYFKRLIESECYYCGDARTNMFSIHKTKNSAPRFYSYNGIDRIENDKGYVFNNCVSCCAICNLMKRGLSINEWKNRMEKILKNLINKDQNQAVATA